MNSIKLPEPNAIKLDKRSPYGMKQRKLNERFVYYWLKNNQWNCIAVRNGFTYDGATIPNYDFRPIPVDLTAFGGPFDYGWNSCGLVHDWIYSRKGENINHHCLPTGLKGSESSPEDWYKTNYTWSRLSADKLFRAMLIRYGVPHWKAQSAYEAVRVFGKHFWDD